MMRELNPYKHYKPQNTFSFRLIPKKEMNVSGYVHTAGGEVSGETYTHHNIVSYDLTIRYEGAVDINGRDIIARSIPNYKNDPAMIRQARNITGIEEQTACENCCQVCCCLTIVCAICAFAYGYDKNVTQVKTLNSKVEELSADRVEQEIAQAIGEADKLVHDRIQAKQAANHPVHQAPIQAANGAVTLSMEQLNMLLRNAQAGAPVQPQTAAAPPAYVPPMVTQYAQHQSAKPLPNTQLQPQMPIQLTAITPQMYR